LQRGACRAAFARKEEEVMTTPAPSFTPGPWTAVTGQGAHIRDWYIRAGVRRDDGTWPAVARCCSSGIGGRATVEANAAFIAAAPDLYAACSEVLQGLELTGAHGSHWATVLRAAIAKARGGVS